MCFNTQPPEGGCPARFNTARISVNVSTHSRPKAAAQVMFFLWCLVFVSTHSRPKAAAFIILSIYNRIIVSTHSRPKAAAFFSDVMLSGTCSFNTQPPEGGCHFNIKSVIATTRFQHTAARRRLLAVVVIKEIY